MPSKTGPAPCESCPWRKDAPRQYWDAGHFRDIWASCQDDGLAVMTCHKAAKLPPARQAELPCRGWIYTMGTNAIGVRLLLVRGTIAERELNPPPRCPTLFESFEAMVKAQGIRLPKRNRAIQPGRRRPLPVVRGERNGNDHTAG